MAQRGSIPHAAGRAGQGIEGLNWVQSREAMPMVKT